MHVVLLMAGARHASTSQRFALTVYRNATVTVTVNSQGSLSRCLIGDFTVRFGMPFGISPNCTLRFIVIAFREQLVIPAGTSS
jgi:hypothetical protein